MQLKKVIATALVACFMLQGITASAQHRHHRYHHRHHPVHHRHHMPHR